MTDELHLLGCMVLDPGIWYESKINPRHFITKEGKAVYDALVTVFTNGQTPTIFLLNDYVQGIPITTVAELTDIPTSVNWRYYEGRVIENALRHRLSVLSAEIKEALRDDTPGEVIGMIDLRLQEMLLSGSGRKIIASREMVSPFIEDLMKRMKDGGKYPGVLTGIRKLDEYTKGFQKARLYYVGARPSQGKSALMLNFVCSAAITGGHKVGVISLESDNDELFLRLVASQSNIDSQNLMTGLIGTHSQISKIEDACQRIGDSGIWFYDEPNMDLTKVVSVARRMVETFGCEVIYVDYLQLISYGSESSPMRDRVAHISKSLKELARNLNVPVVCLAQLRRDADNRKPAMGDFAESSQVEKDADVAILIWHRQKENEDETSYLVVEKNRDGATGAVPVKFIRPVVRFGEVERE